MRVSGRRVHRTRVVRTEKYVVFVAVEAVCPKDDPSEACYESETVRLLRDVQVHAERGDLRWLQRRGKVYQAVEVRS